MYKNIGADTAGIALWEVGSIDQFYNSKTEENWCTRGFITTQIRKNVASESFVNTDLYLCNIQNHF